MAHASAPARADAPSSVLSGAHRPGGSQLPAEHRLQDLQEHMSADSSSGRSQSRVESTMNLAQEAKGCPQTMVSKMGCLFVVALYKAVGEPVDWDQDLHDHEACSTWYVS